jgi:heme-degrading monooxygenase HmoA
VYARSTTISAPTSAVDAGIAFVRDEVLPTVRAMEGCLGLSLLVDREAGRCISTTSWQSAEARRNSGGTVLSLRERAVQLMGAETPVVEEWEIASMHRAHHAEPGTWVRAARSRVSPEMVDRAIAFYKDTLLPDIERLDGFASASLLVDRAAGRGVTSVAFDTREAMERTRAQADYLRGRSTNDVDVEFLDVAEFELALAHLHVPELV